MLKSMCYIYQLEWVISRSLCISSKLLNLRIPDSYNAKIAKICNLWTLWPVIQLMNRPKCQQGFPTELTPRVIPCCIVRILEECMVALNLWWLGEIAMIVRGKKRAIAQIGLVGDRMGLLAKSKRLSNLRDNLRVRGCAVVFYTSESHDIVNSNIVWDQEKATESWNFINYNGIVLYCFIFSHLSYIISNMNFGILNS